GGRPGGPDRARGAAGAGRQRQPRLSRRDRGRRMDLASLTRHQRTAGRVAEIVKVLARYSLADWLRKVNVQGVRHFLTGVDGRPIAGVPFEARVRLALTDLGPTA